MSYIFYDADSFNQSLNSWDVSSVTDMDWLFWSADSFNQNISMWNVSNVVEYDLFSNTLPPEYKPNFN